jgi:hypothetical protein
VLMQLISPQLQQLCIPLCLQIRLQSLGEEQEELLQRLSRQAAPTPLPWPHRKGALPRAGYSVLVLGPRASYGTGVVPSPQRRSPITELQAIRVLGRGNEHIPRPRAIVTHFFLDGVRCVFVLSRNGCSGSSGLHGPRCSEEGE